MPLGDTLEQFTRRDWQTDPDGELRIAMIGLGWWTREEAIPAVDATDHATTTVAVSGSAEKAASVAGAHDTIQKALTYEEFQAGSATDAYDAVYVCTPNALHLPHVETAAEFGKAVLCEKPMESSVERAERLVEACVDVPLMIAYRMQTEPAVRRARELVHDGAIGEPVLVHGSMSQRLLEIIPDPDQWRLDPDLSGYGTSVMDIGLYPLNTARFVLGKNPVSAAGMDATHHPAFDEVPDERAAFLLRFEDDVLGSFTSSQNAYQSSHLRVIGTAGEFHLDPVFFPWTDRRFELRHDGTRVDLDWDQVDQMVEEFEYFADCVLDDREPAPDGRHGLVDMRTMAAVYEAARSGQEVSV